MAILLNDSSGDTWKVVVDDSGNVSLLATTKQSAPTVLNVNPATGYFHTDYPYVNQWNVYFSMNSTPSNSWALTVVGGVLTPTSLPFASLWPLYLPVVSSPDGTVWRPYVDAAGNVKAVRSWFDSPNTSSFGSAQGQLDPYPSESSGKAVQPGPATTVIDPDIFPEQFTGWFRSGCGHSLMVWELAPTTQGGIGYGTGEYGIGPYEGSASPMVQVRCPYDGYVNNVYTQAEIDAMMIVLG